MSRKNMRKADLLMLEELKEAVYDANMQLAEKKLVIYTWGNVSGIDREKGIMAIKPSGVSYELLKPADIVLVSIENGSVVEGRLNPSSDTPTHLYLYRTFSQVGGITHTHSACATAWAQAGREIPCYGTTHADYFCGAIPCTRFLTAEETSRGYESETGRIIEEAFQGMNPMFTPGVLVRGHGPFTWGKDAAQSVYHAAVLEETARMALWTQTLSREGGMPLPMHIQKKHFERKHGENAYYGQK